MYCGGGWHGGWMPWGGPFIWFGFLIALGALVLFLVRGKKIEHGEEAPCPKCAGPVKKVYFRCPHCGDELKKHCPECSRVVDSQWGFCPFCRETLKGEIES